MRHGFKKVTMNDIAEEAGMSRPAVYLIFKNKTDIFKEVVIQFFDQATSEIQDGLGRCDTAGEKLRLAFEVWYVRPAESAVDTPYTLELTETFDKYAGEQHKDGMRQFEEILESILSPYSDVLENQNLTPKGLARMLGLAGNGFKQENCGPEKMKELIDALITLVLAVLENPASFQNQV